MQPNQITFWETLEAFVNTGTNSETVGTSVIPDIRSEKQKGNFVSYDVGEKIGMAKKDISAIRINFLEKPSLELLHEMEKTDVRVAAEVLKRPTFFSWFSLASCKEVGVEPGVAKAIQLFINRIPKESADSPVAREKYARTLLILSAGLQGIKTKDEYFAFEKYITALYSAEHTAKRITCVGNLKYQERGYWMLKDLADSLAIRDQEFRGAFMNYFFKPKSRETALNRVIFEEDWEKVIPTNKPKVAKTTKAKEVIWKRDIPEDPVRDAGSSIQFSTPEEFGAHFNFRSVEFGNYVEDHKAAFHLRNAAEAYVDLSEILTIPHKAVSLDGTLAMAFGSRGSGSALGHYEASRQVINLTKVNGSLGILAHEWYHALDSYLYNASHHFENGKIGFLSKGTEGAALQEAQSAMGTLLKTIKEGTTTAYIDVSGAKKSYTVYQPFIDMYQAVRGNLQAFMDVEIREFDRMNERRLNGCVSEKYKEEMVKKIAKKRVSFIRSHAEALSEYHFKQTGELVKSIPYTTNRTAFYQNSINMDKGVVSKYWSSDVEMTARAFESYVAEELKQLKWRNDYLVCGAIGSVYPEGTEREVIHVAMANFIDTIRSVLSKGGLSFD
ncbi:LPD1 domain-containing protein [Psychrobacillus sp. FSL H8-0510]|uniref:LPD1 domain-containing protein n=1 Tax=Psychrobacillus sp. FSL H8-0510 TaxID=2921394 RepID=UPI0030F609CA